jgi:hypothetical protein
VQVVAFDAINAGQQRIEIIGGREVTAGQAIATAARRAASRPARRGCRGRC